MDNVTPYDVFCSYCWRDRTAVEAVAQALQRQGLQVFLDRWYLVPGRPWPQALEEILASCRAVAVFVGSQGLGDWQQREAYLALNRKDTTPVIPVLLPGADPALGFLSLHTWVDLRPGLDDPLPLEILHKAIRGEPPGSDLRDRVQATRNAVCPYRGLRPFREEDAPFFFGRKEFIDRLTEAVSRQNLVALVGASGCGKSSVARAGLVPRLRHQEGSGLVWETVTFLPGDRPLHALAAALLPLLEPEMTEVDRLAEVSKLAQYFQEGDLALRDVVARVLDKQPGTERLLLVADQWEELYTLTREEEARSRFLDEILEATQAASLSLVLTLRGDFYGQALSYRPLADRFQDAVVNLGPMTREELAQAIEEPAKKVGLTFEPGLVERLLNDVGQEPGSLPLLEFALTNLWERRHGGQLLHQVYEDMGRVQGAVAQQAEELYQKLTPLEQQAAGRVFLDLVQTGESTVDTRRRAPLTEVGAETRELVKKLTDARLVVTGRDAATGQETVEVAHEALIQHWGRLRGWLNADREFLLWRQRLRHDLEDWQRTHRDEGALLRGASLAEAERWHTERAAHLTPGEREFIQVGIDLRERERHTRQRQQRRRVWTLSTGLLAALLLLALAGWQWWRADKQRQIALSRQLAAQANLAFSQQARYLTRSVLLAVESLQRSPTAEGLQTLSRGLALLPQQVSNISIPVPGKVIKRAISPNGQYLATLDEDHLVRLWEMDTGREVTQLHCKDLYPSSLFSSYTAFNPFSPDGRWLAIWVDDGITIWETATGREAARLAGKNVFVFTWDRQSQRLALACIEKDSGRASDTTTVIVLDAASGRETAKISGPFLLKGASITSPVTAMDFSPDGRWLATGGSGLSQVWDLASGRELIQMRQVFPFKPSPSQQEFQLPENIGTMVFSPDGRLLATSGLSPGNAATLWEAATGRLIARLTHPGGCDVLTFSPDGGLLATAAGNRGISGTSDSKERNEQETGQRTVKIWDTTSGSERYQLVHGDKVVQVAFSPKFQLLATSSWDGTARWWESGDGREVARLGEEGPYGLAFRPDGVQLLTLSQNYKAQVWDPAQVSEVRLKHDRPVNTLAFSPDGRWLATGIADHNVLLWDTSTGKEMNRLADSELGSILAFSPDGRTFATAGFAPTGTFESVGKGPLPSWAKPQRPTEDKKIRFVLLYQVPGGRELARLTHPGGVTAVTFTPDGSRLITGCTDGVVRIWDLATCKEIFHLEPKKKDEWDAVVALAVSPDDHFLAASYLIWGFPGLWTLADGREAVTFEHNEGRISSIKSLTFSRNSRWLAGGIAWGSLVWDTATGKQVIELSHHDKCRTVAFHPSMPWLATGSRDHTTSIWELPGGREMTRIIHAGPVAKMTFSPDGRFVASAEQCPGEPWRDPICRAVVRLWEAATGVEVAQFRHRKGINDIAFSPDGRLLASASSDGTARLWRWQPEDLIRQACSRLTRNLTRAEWRQYLGDEEPYRPTCPDLPVPEE